MLMIQGLINFIRRFHWKISISIGYGRSNVTCRPRGCLRSRGLYFNGPGDVCALQVGILSVMAGTCPVFIHKFYYTEAVRLMTLRTATHEAFVIRRTQHSSLIITLTNTFVE